MSCLTCLFRDVSDTSQVKTFPVFHSVWGIWSWLVTATRPIASMLMSRFEEDLCFDSANHLIWGLKPHPEHESLCGPDTSLGTRRSSTDGSTKWEINQCINESVYLNRTTRCETLKRERLMTNLTKNIACRVWLKVAGEALIHCAGEPCVFLPVCLRDSEASSDWMDAWGLMKINILFFRDVDAVGLKGYIQMTGGELCDVTLQHSTVSLQQIW